jgi:hypothetical protein
MHSQCGTIIFTVGVNYLTFASLNFVKIEKDLSLAIMENAKAPTTVNIGTTWKYSVNIFMTAAEPKNIKTMQVKGKYNYNLIFHSNIETLFHFNTTLMSRNVITVVIILTTYSGALS